MSEFAVAKRSDSDNIQVPPIAVAVVSDVRFVRDALVALLGESERTRVVAATGDLATDFEHAVALPADIALIDTGLPHALNAVRRIRAIAPHVRIVAFAMAEREEDVIAWAEAGISGYIPRSAALQDVVRLLESTMHNEQPCAPHIANSLMRRLGAGLFRATERPALTQREMEIIHLVSEGLSNKEIANRLSIGLATTKSHVHNALGKLGLVRRGQVAQWMHYRTSSARGRGYLASPPLGG